MDYGHEKPEVTAVSIDPNFSSYLYDDYLMSISDTNISDDVFLERYFSDITPGALIFSVLFSSLVNVIFPGISGSTGATLTFRLPWRPWMVSGSVMASNTRYPANPQRY
jgi:hypothetical protein